MRYLPGPTGLNDVTWVAFQTLKELTAENPQASVAPSSLAEADHTAEVILEFGLGCNG
jgi:hypothetical protein